MRVIYEILDVYVRPYAGFIGPDFNLIKAISVHKGQVSQKSIYKQWKVIQTAMPAHSNQTRFQNSNRHYEVLLAVGEGDA